MSLTLTLDNQTSLPDGGPLSVSIQGKRGIDIGRDTHLDWTLPDPTRYISSKHCEVRYKDGGYWLHDVSTNGTFLNGADHRMQAPHRLRHGDRFIVGHYIVAVAVAVDGEQDSVKASPQPPSPAPARSVNYQELWSSQGEVPPPIDPKQLKPARHDAPVHSDFLDWAVDVPDPFRAPAPSYSGSRSAAPTPASAPEWPINPDMGWAAGPPSRVPACPSPPPPTPRRPDWDARRDNPWRETKPSGSDDPIGGAVPPGEIAAPAPPSPASAADLAAPATFAAQFARAAGLPEDALTQRNPAELAQQIGAVVRLVADNLMQLLNARLQAKRLARSSSHTTVQALDNNPLKFCPSPPDALRIMFGPSTASYLDAQRAIGQGFEDLKAHQIKTYSAMQKALIRLMADFDPQAIEQDTDEGRRIAGLLMSRKAKLWDAYQARWEARFGGAGGKPIEVFMAYFAEFYDRDE
jgi:type VI secretion system protein ImpI